MEGSWLTPWTRLLTYFTVCHSRGFIQVHTVERCLELLLLHRINSRSEFSFESSFGVWILKQGQGIFPKLREFANFSFNPMH